jgi:ABC-type lipopolysaccharide export system ATPase subunit
MRRDPRAEGGLDRGPRRPDHGAARRERRRQDHDAEGDLGILRAERGEVIKGTIEFGGERIDQLPPHDIVKRGIVQVFEGRRVFEHLTVEENLVAGGHTVTELKSVRDGIELVYPTFPVLKERRGQQSGYLSGGEQQMLADRPRADVAAEARDAR